MNGGYLGVMSCWLFFFSCILWFFFYNKHELILSLGENQPVCSKKEEGVKYNFMT